MALTLDKIGLLNGPRTQEWYFTSKARPWSDGDMELTEANSGTLDREMIESHVTDDMKFRPIHDLIPSEIIELRLRKNLSLTEFAEYLNLDISIVEKLETGEIRATGPALRILNLIFNAVKPRHS